MNILVAIILEGITKFFVSIFRSMSYRIFIK